MYTIIGILLIGLVLLALLAFVMDIARNNEKKEYNDGICTKCGNKLRLFDKDSQGGRGYRCSKCGRTIWVSYNVDNQERRRR